MDEKELARYLLFCTPLNGGNVITHKDTFDMEVTIETTMSALESFFEEVLSDFGLMSYLDDFEEKDMARKEFIDGKLIEKAKEALYDECVFQSTPIIKDGFRLSFDEWAGKAVWRTPSWISKDELIELLVDRLSDDYELLHDKFPNAKEPADDVE